MQAKIQISTYETRFGTSDLNFSPPFEKKFSPTALMASLSALIGFYVGFFQAKENKLITWSVYLRLSLHANEITISVGKPRLFNSSNFNLNSIS